MLRKILIGIVLGVLVVVLAVWLWARGVLAGEGVRGAVAAQLTRALGEPVDVGGVSASIFPRITLTLDDVTIGAPARITADRLRVGASLRALVSRRIEHASIALSGARIELPLPDFARAADDQPARGAQSSGGPPVEIVSVDEILVSDATIVSGNRTLEASLELVPDEEGLLLRRFDLEVGGETMAVTGRITDLRGPVAQLTVTAGTIHFDELMQFVSDFVSEAGPLPVRPDRAGTRETSSTAVDGALASSAMNVEVSLAAAAGRFGSLTIADLDGHARITSAALTFDSVRFVVFGGHYDGALTLTLENSPAFRLNAVISGVDMQAVTAFAGQSGLLTGRLSSSLDVHGRGLDADAVLGSARGTAHAEIADGVVQNLGLVRAVVLAGSGRRDSQTALADVSSDEPFSRLSATLNIADGTAHTDDLHFESPSVALSADGLLALDGSVIDLEGQIRLSQALTEQAGRDLVRYTQEDGRVTLPVTVSGSVEDFRVGIDLAGLARRALINRATEEAGEAIREGLGGLIGR